MGSWDVSSVAAPARPVTVTTHPPAPVRFTDDTSVTVSVLLANGNGFVWPICIAFTACGVDDDAGLGAEVPELLAAKEEFCSSCVGAMTADPEAAKRSDVRDGAAKGEGGLVIRIVNA